MIKKVLLIILIILAGAGFYWWYTRKNQGVHYITVPVVRGNLASSVEATGTINPVVNVTVGAQVSGKIIRIYVDYNSRVSKGQQLAQIDPTSYQAAVDQSRADLNNAEASLAVANSNIQNALAVQSQAEHNISTVEAQIKRDKANLANAEINFKRLNTLAQRNLIARSDADTARYTYEAGRATVQGDESQLRESKDRLASAKVQVQVAEGQLKSAAAVRDKAKAQLEQSMANFGYTKIISPVDGTVVARNVDVGQTVVSSFQAPSLFLIAQDLRKMQIDTQVDEASVGKIKIGHKVKFNVAAFPAEDFSGKVSQVRINPITQQNVVNYDVVVAVSNPGLKLLPGMTATVNFIVDEGKNVLIIPNSALRFVPPEEKKQMQKLEKLQKRASVPHVWVLEKNKIVRRDIKTGISDDTETEVISGLNERELVVTEVETSSGRNVNPFSPRRF